LNRTQALEIVLGEISEKSPVLATTGKTGRELYALEDRPGNFYMVGSMGCLPSLGLGIARGWQGMQPLVLLDGDGAALMRLEALVSVGAYRPPGLVHVILDNHSYDSTGGQDSLSSGVDFLALAHALGYQEGFRVCSAEALRGAFQWALVHPGPTLIHLSILSGSPPSLPRPPEEPAWYASRFRDFLTETKAPESGS
jgi:phosphonopyruvate decarboxylase